MKRVINVGLIGFGNSGQTFLAPFINANDGFNLKKISTSNPSNTAKAKSVYPQAAIVSDVDSIMNDGDIELVFIGTPNTSHLNLAKQALLTGKHVVVEKPFTITSADADELIALAKQQNRILTVHHNRRFDSGHNTVKKVLASGGLGKLVEFEVHYDRFRRELRPNAWREKNLPGSGVLYDLGVHLIDSVVDLFGTPKTITCMILTQREGLAVDDNFEIIFNYSGLKVTMKAGMLVKVPGPVYTLYGDRGAFIKYGMDVQEEALKKGANPNSENWGIEPENIWGKLTTEENGVDVTHIIKSEAGRYQKFFQNVYDAIAEGKALIVKPEQSRQVIHLLELALQSNRERRTVDYIS